MGKEVTGLDNLGLCCDVLDLDPLDVGRSCKNKRAIDTTGDDVEQRKQGEYSVPLGVELRSPHSSEFKSERSLIFNSFDFQNEFTSSIETNIGVPGIFEFSTSSSCTEITKKTESRERVFTYVMANAQHHVVSFDLLGEEAKKLVLNNAFKGAVAALPAAAGTAYQDFIRQFGTHFLSQVSLGGMAYSRVSSTKEKVLSSSESRRKFDTEASFEIGEYLKGGTKLSDAHNQIIERDKKNEIEREHVVFRGGTGNTELQGSWFASAEEHPVPIAKDLKLQRLSELFTPRFFPNDSAIDVKRKLLNEATTTYILKRGGDVGGQICYGRSVKLLIATDKFLVYYNPKDDKGDAVLYAQRPERRPPPQAKQATIDILGKEATGAVVYTNQVVNLRINEAQKYLTMPSTSEPGNGWGKPTATAKAEFQVRVVGSMVQGVESKPRPLISGDVVIISRYDEARKKFATAMAVMDPSGGGVIRFMFTDVDPLFNPRFTNSPGACFVVQNVSYADARVAAAKE